MTGPALPSLAVDMAGGLLAEFEAPDRVVIAVQKMRAAGYRRLEVYSPYPVPEIEQALALPEPRLSWVVFVLGALGAAVGFFIQWFCNAHDYPIDVGGRPLNSVPTSIPVAFETCILWASIAAVLGVFVAARLPRWWRPIFEAPGFDRAFVDRFFLGVDARDERFDRARSESELAELGALSVVPFGEGAP